jgi:hypothetical protein
LNRFGEAGFADKILSALRFGFGGHEEKEPNVMTRGNSFGGLIFVLILAIGGAAAYGLNHTGDTAASISVFIAAFLVASIVSASIKVADQWDRAVVLRLGKFRCLQGPGLFFIVPFIDAIPYWIDTRVITTSFKAEKTLTKDTVPVDVDAVLFWKVLDPQKAALDVADYQSAICWREETRSAARCRR